MVDKEITTTQPSKSLKSNFNNIVPLKKPTDNAIKKSGHQKSYSAVDEEFAFNNNKEQNDLYEIQLEHFMNNYDELIIGLKNTVQETKMNKNNSDPNKIKPEKRSKESINKPKKTHSASMNFDDLSHKSLENDDERATNESKSTNTNETGSKKAKSKRGSLLKKKNPEELNDLVAQVDKKMDIKQWTSIEEIKDYYEYTENCLKVIAKLEVPEEKDIEHLKLELPEKLTKKKLAIFDLDETLIHCELKEPQKADKLITITLPNMKKARVSEVFIILY
jgi:hypothetical protein